MLSYHCLIFRVWTTFNRKNTPVIAGQCKPEYLKFRLLFISSGYFAIIRYLNLVLTTGIV